MMWMIYPSLTASLMESHKIFGTTANLENVRKKDTNQMQLTKIRWEEALKVAKSATYESEVARQFQIEASTRAQKRGIRQKKLHVL